MALARDFPSLICAVSRVHNYSYVRGTKKFYGKGSRIRAIRGGNEGVFSSLG